MQVVDFSSDFLLGWKINIMITDIVYKWNEKTVAFMNALDIFGMNEKVIVRGLDKAGFSSNRKESQKQFFGTFSQHALDSLQ